MNAPVPESRLSCRRVLAASSLVVLWLVLGAEQGRAGEPGAGGLDPLAGITVAEGKEKLAFLVSEACAGRRAGTEGAARAAEYIASVFRRAGLEPGGEEGSFFQRVKVPPATMPGPGNELEIRGARRSFAQVPLRDFAPFAFSPDASVAAPVVFAGFGLVQEGWNDYAGLDVAGKLVLVMRGGPAVGVGAGPQYTFHARAKAAQDRGAAGLIVVSDPAKARDADPLALLAGSGEGIRIPCAHASARIGDALLRVAGETLAGIRERMDRLGRPQSVEIPAVRVRLATSVTRGRAECVNVVGVLGGRDPVLSRECVVVGAHYDHLGFGDVGARGAGGGGFFPGADDNASGTVGVLEIAEGFAGLPVRPRRSLVFVCFTGEEAGLVGSRAYAERPLFPPERTVAMLNMDMIGRGEPNRLGIGGVGTGDGFEAVIEEANGTLGLELRLGRGAGGGSDHASFLPRGIPSLFLHAGANPEYHTPGDTADRILFENLTGASKLVFLIAARLSAADGRPVFVAPKGGGEGGGKGVRLGFFPDDWYDGKGAFMQTVLADTPARRAGLKDGDIVLAYDGKPVADIGALRALLNETERGSTVRLRVLSDGALRDVEVRFD